MQVRDDLTDLPHQSGCLHLRIGWPLLERFAKMAIERALHESVEVEQIIEEAINLHDVGVGEGHLDSQFSDQLLHHCAFPDFSLRHYLYGKHQPTLALHRKNHPTESAPAQLAHNHEVLYAPSGPTQLDWVQTILVMLESGKERGDCLLRAIVL